MAGNWGKSVQEVKLGSKLVSMDHFLHQNDILRKVKFRPRPTPYFGWGMRSIPHVFKIIENTKISKEVSAVLALHWMNGAWEIRAKVGLKIF